MEILICTDGSISSILPADLVAKLEFPSVKHIVMLGVSEDKTNDEKLNHSMDVMEKYFRDKYSFSRKIRRGQPIDEILAEALEYPYDLVAVAGGGKQMGLLQPNLGSTTSRLARKLHTHFLVARNIPERIGKILICVSAEAPMTETITLGGSWIANTAAQIGLLHVTPSNKLDAGRVRKDNGRVQKSSGADKGESDLVIQQASRQLRDIGVKAELIPHLRQGLVVDEVLDELSEGGFDLLVVGAHYQPGQDRWQETLLDDVTDQLLNRSTCSVLII